MRETRRACRGAGGSDVSPRGLFGCTALKVGFVVVALAAFLTAVPTAPADGFPNGDAQATADTLALNMIAGNLVVGMTAGRSTASYKDRTGTADGRALDLGALPTLLAQPCDANPSFLNPATLPPLTSVNSSDEGSAASHSTRVFLPGLRDGPAGAPIGYQDATATATPSSWASTQSDPVDAVLVSVDGGRTEVSTSLQGQVREAHALSTANQLRILGGLFTFNQPRWEATARSGAQTTATGSFTFSSASVLGTTKPADEIMKDLQGFKESTEKFLAPLGVQFDLPSVKVTDTGVEVTPMGFRIQNPPLGMNVVIPFLDKNAADLQSWRDDVKKQGCQSDLFLTVVDVIIAVFGGAGSIETLAGGVSATTTATDYSVPPPVTEPPTTEAPTTTPTVEASNVSTADTAPVDAGSFTTATTPVTRTTPRVTTPKPAPKRITQDQVVVPAASKFEDGTAGKAGVVVGSLALLGALALAAGDRFVGRRARRRIP